jgi:biopolymer transport protein ExbB
MTFAALFDVLDRGGAALWAIAALSVLALGVTLWKLWRFGAGGIWSGAADSVVTQWADGRAEGAEAAARMLSDPLGQVVAAAIRTRSDPAMSDAQAREETERVARAQLASARSGLRILDLTVTVAPLLGLLGTVLGMIDAFQALQTAGSSADAAALAGGIWEALLTTAAGMAVAIPASVALTWFDSVIERLQARMEDAATRIFTTGGRP